jgi:hypothetical protein
MPAAPIATIVTFRGNLALRAFDVPTPLATGLYHHGNAAEEQALNQHDRWLIFQLNATFGVKHLWLLATAPVGLVPNRLLVEKDAGYTWDDLEERVLDRLACHFGWPHVDLYRHRTHRTSARDPLKGLLEEAA